MRSGELLGLQRRDIDPLHRTVTVERQAHELTGLGRVLTHPSPRPDAGLIALPSFVLHALEGHLRDFVAPAYWCVRLHPANRAPASAPGPLPCVDRCLRGGRHRGRATPRSAAPRRHGDRKEPERDAARAHGHHRPFVACGRAALPARHGGTEQRDRRLSRQRDQLRPATRCFIGVRRGSSGLWHGCGMERTRPEASVAKRVAPTGRTTRGGGRNRTAVRGFAGPCLNHSATPPLGRPNTPSRLSLRDARPAPTWRMTTPTVRLLAACRSTVAPWPSNWFRFAALR